MKMRLTLASIAASLLFAARAASAGPVGTLECPNSDVGVRLIDLAKSSLEAAITSLTTLYGTPQSEVRDSRRVTLTWRQGKTSDAPASSVVLTLGLTGDQPYECNSGWSQK